MLIPVFVIGLCIIREFRVEAALRVDFENVEIVKIDGKYFDSDKTTVSISEDEETGDTTISSTVVLIKQLPAEIQGHLTLRGLSMGKYTVPTGIDVKMLLCEMLDEPIMVGPFLAVLGFGQGPCPPEPGTYSQEGYKLSTESLPDEFPENKYLVVFEMSLKGKSILTANIYVNLQIE